MNVVSAVSDDNLPVKLHPHLLLSLALKPGGCQKVKPATLQLLMRHKSIETTMRYYVCQDSDYVADGLWEAHEALRRRDSSKAG